MLQTGQSNLPDRVLEQVRGVTDNSRRLRQWAGELRVQALELTERSRHAQMGVARAMERNRQVRQRTRPGRRS